MHKSLKRSNITKVLIQSLLKLEILFLLKCNQNLSLTVTYHGPYRVYEATNTNVKVKPVSSPDADAESKTISLQKVSKCKGSFLANQFWRGHNITNPRKQRRVHKKQNTRSQVRKWTASMWAT